MHFYMLDWDDFGTVIMYNVRNTYKINADIECIYKEISDFIVEIIM